MRLGDAQDLEVFWSLHLELCRRRGVASNVPALGYVRRVWQEFHGQGRAWMFTARLGEKTVCSHICIGVGTWFYAWRIGTASDAMRAHPSQAAYAHAIRAAAAAGYRFFDFLEVHPDEAASLERGEVADTPTAGMTFCKLGFGGKVRRLAPALIWFPHPAVRLLMRAVGMRLLRRWEAG